MAPKKVFVQLDEELALRLDRLAAREGTSRSALMSRGARAVLAAAELVSADEQLRGAYRRTPQNSEIVDLAARLAAKTMPDW